jgi:hypothetical protein
MRVHGRLLAGQHAEPLPVRRRAMSFVLNPGDGHDIEEFDRAEEALHALLVERGEGFPLARLYSYGAGVFREYVAGNWYVVERGNLPNKVVAVHHRRARPGLLPSEGRER